MFREFRDFLMRGNVLDLAVAVVMGGAFGAIVNSLVNDIVMPIVGVLLGGLDFTTLAVTIGDSRVLYGNFIQAIVNFVIIGLSMFFFVKVANNVVKKKEAAPPPPHVPTAEETLLGEIRDLLKTQNKR
jgi:large conductance mechanosensitive channel